MAVNTQISVQVIAEQTNPADLSTPTDPLTLIRTLSLVNGTGANQADRIFHDTRTITASATDSLDLAGVLTDKFGSTLTFAKLKALIVAASSANTNNVVVTRPATNGVPLFSAAGDACPVLPGGHFWWMAPGAGVTVTATTGDLIDMVNSGGGSSVIYDVVILGTSA